MDSLTACQKKTKYSKAEAKEQSALRNRDNGRGGTYYHCKHCRKYHLTSRTSYIP